MRYAGESTDSPCDLDWGEIENYGTGSELGLSLNRDGTSDYGGINDLAEIGDMRSSREGIYHANNRAKRGVPSINSDAK